MCVRWTGKWRVTTRSIIAYKRVSRSEGVFLSPVSIDRRRPQHSRFPRSMGSILFYKLGKVTSSGYPGIYLFRDEESCKGSSSAIGYFNIVMIKVRIPKGSRIRVAKGRRINATRVIPLNIHAVNVTPR